MSNNKNKKVKVHNKTDIPDNIIIKRHLTINECEEIESTFPDFFADFFLFIKGSVTINTRLAYLTDLRFFLNYLINQHPKFKKYSRISDIKVEDFSTLKAKDINQYIGNYCSQYINDGVVILNNNRTLARKRSSLSVLFKHLYREEIIKINIVDGFNPIKLPKPQPDAIKKLEIEEIPMILDIVSTGSGLTSRERVYWEKTKLRDKAILVLFITYGLRVSELQQLDLSSFNYQRNEFKIYRKRGKESTMPLNNSVINSIKEYTEKERPAVAEKALFISLQGKRMTVRAIREMVKKYTSIVLGTTRSAGFSPHKLRATAASTLIEYGFSIYDVQNLLDHENVTTTQLYSAHKKNAKIDLINQYEILNDED